MLHTRYAVFLAALLALGTASFITLIGVAPATIQRQVASSLAGRSIETRTPNLKIMTVAHRGASKFAPEGTLAAYRKAIDLGVGYVELDVRLTRDGIPVILHDQTINRTTSGTGEIRNLPYADISELDAGSWFGPQFAAERIPTLEQTLQVLAGQSCVFWDMKAPPARQVVELFQHYGFGRGCLLITFGGLGGGINTSEVNTLLRLWPDAPVLPTVKKPADIVRAARDYPQATAVRTYIYLVTETMVKTAHAAGLQLFTSTLAQTDTPKYYRQAIAAGADMIMLDNIDDLNALLDSMGR